MSKYISPHYTLTLSYRSRVFSRLFSPIAIHFIVVIVVVYVVSATLYPNFVPTCSIYTFLVFLYAALISSLAIQ